MEIIQIVLGVIMIAVGVNLFIVVGNLSKNEDEEDEEATDYNEGEKPKRSLLARILSALGYTIAILIILAGIGYIGIHVLSTNKDTFDIIDFIQSYR